MSPKVPNQLTFPNPLEKSSANNLMTPNRFGKASR
jgi:hypothetical protein